MLFQPRKSTQRHSGNRSERHRAAKAPRQRPPAWLRLEEFESRILMAVNPGATLTSPDVPIWNQLFDGANAPAVSTTGFFTGQYAGPGTNPLVPPSQGGNKNVPFKVNGSPTFNQPVQTSDWWTNLMLRTDPDTIDGVTYAYANAPFVSEPAVLKFINNRFDGNNPWVQGLGIYNPSVFGIDPTPAGPNTISKRILNFTPPTTPLILGIGGNVATDTDTQAQEITPVGVGDHPSGGVDEGRLNVRVNHYSDWGVQVVYGDGNPDNPADPNKPLKNSLTIDMLNGSPFTYFRKTSVDSASNAFAKVWLNGTQVPGTAPALPVNVVWGQGMLPAGVLAVTLTTNGLDESGVLRSSTSSYLVIASGGSWSLRDENNSGGDPRNPQLWVNPMANGTIVVAALPTFVGRSKFEDLSEQDKVKVAQLYLGVAGNFPANGPTATQVSDPQAGVMNYDGVPLRFGYDPNNGQVTTKYTVTTANNLPTYQLLYPHQYNYLVSSDQNSFLNFTPTSGPDAGFSVGLSYQTLMGTARVYSGNTFATRVLFHGTLNSLPNVAVQTDAVAAQALFEDAEAFMTRYIPDPNFAIGIAENTYNRGLMTLSEELQLVDDLASPSSKLSDAQRAQAAGWRDRLLQDLKSQLFSWFDLSTGRLFQLNTKYDTVIGYPAGFGSDIAVSDHHFHYGYFLTAFATIGQFDPAFVQAMRPQVELLIRDVANFNRADQQLPFLREFNPWAGHSWANGVPTTGGNDEESASEAINFASNMVRLGMVLGNQAWVAQGAYLYQTEVEAMNQYWFNADADPANGDFGNYSPEFARYLVNGNVVHVTQVANVKQNELKRWLFFDSPNYAEAIYAINWLPTAAWMLFLGGNQDYLQRNWAQFVQDYHQDGRNAVNEAVVAAYQALMPDEGFGLDQPGPTNALLRIDPDVNPSFAPPNEIDPGFVGGYTGTNRSIARKWIYEMQKLGQVDHSVTADSPSYAVFLKDGQRTFVAYNPTAAVDTIRFRDARSGATLTYLVVQPGETVTQLPDGSLLSDRSGTGRTSAGTSLYLTKPPGQDPNDPNGLTLSKQPGTAGPTAIPVSPTQQQIIGAYAGTYNLVPKRPGAATPNPDQPPSDPRGIRAFNVSGLNGTYRANGQTGLQLFLDNALTWEGSPAPDKWGNHFGPGVIQNLSFGAPNAVIEVSYDFNGDGNFERVETYTAPLRNGVNQFNLADTLTPPAGISDPNVQSGQPVLNAALSNLQPFQNMVNGSVRVRLWQGLFDPNNNSHKEFAVSVNADPVMARSSRLVIPYTDNDSGPAVLQVNTTPRGRTNTPVNAVTVNLSQPANPGAFTENALTFTRNGVRILLQPGTVTVTLVPGTTSTYQISGLAAYQANQGVYVLTVNGALIKGPGNSVGSGTASVSWALDKVGPTLQLLSDTSPTTGAAPIAVTALFSEPVNGFTAADLRLTNATASNFRGTGALYTFELTPTRPGVLPAVNVVAGAATDAAGNPSGAAGFQRTYAAVGPTVVLSSTANDVTNATSILVTAKFSAAVTGFTAADLIVRNAVASNFTPVSGDTYTFTLTPNGPGAVTVDVPAGAGQDGQNRPSAAPATFRRTSDQVNPTGVTTAINNYVTYESTIPVVVEFSEPVTGFDASKVSVSNGTVVAQSFQGSGSRYSFDVTAASIGPVIATIAAGAAMDAAGNASAAFTPLSRAFRLIPTVTLSSPMPLPTNSSSVPFQIAFNQAMTLDPSQILVTNGSVVGPVTSINGSLYTFNVQPTASPVTVVLNANAGFNAYGNGNPAAQFEFQYGTAPVLQAVAAVHNGQNGFLDVTLTFDQNVKGMDASKLQVVGGNATVADFAGAGSVYTLKLTPKPVRSDYGTAMTFILAVPAGAIVSERGIPNAATQVTITPGSVQNGPFTVTGPTVTMTSDQPLLKYAGGKIKITATFSEGVTGFDWNNLIVTGGTVPQATFMADPNDARVYTFDFTPNPSGTGTVVINTQGPTVVKTIATPVVNAMANPAPFNRIVTSPVVSDVNTSVPAGTYHAGAEIPILVTFNAQVMVVGTPVLALNASGTAHDAVAKYTASNAAGTVLTFLYTVRPGDNAAALDVDSASPLQPFPAGAAITLPNGDPIPGDQLNLFSRGVPHSLPANKMIVIDTNDVTRVVGVTSPLANGDYGAGQTIPIQVKFSSPVTVTGTPKLLLADVGDEAVYTGPAGPDTLTFQYLVGAGLVSRHLDYLSAEALVGGTITADNHTPVQRALPAPGSPGSLSFTKALAIASVMPKVLSVSAPASSTNKTFGITQTIPIQVNFSAAVDVTGSPLLHLSSSGTSNGTATYASGSGSSSLTFHYVVLAGQSSPNLDVASTTALDLNGGTIKDKARVTTVPAFDGNPADLTLPAPGAAGSLSNVSDNRNIKVAGVRPVVTAVFAAVNGARSNGDAFNVYVKFNSQLVLTPGMAPLPTLAMSDGGTATFVSFEKEGKGAGNTMIFQYSPLKDVVGNGTRHLDVASPTALNLGTSTLKDLGGNDAVLTLPVEPAAGSLFGNNLIATFTNPLAAPTVVNVTSPLFDGTFGAGQVVPITVTFSGPVTVTGTPQLQLSTGGVATYVPPTGGSGVTRTLTFLYTVGTGQNAARLDYANAMALTGGTIKNFFLDNGVAADADRTLPAPGTVGSLGFNTRIAVDTTTTAAPKVVTVTSPNPPRQYMSSDVITIRVQFDRAVTVTPGLLIPGLFTFPVLQLRQQSGLPVAAAVYSGGSGTDTLTFTYTVRQGQHSALLDLASTQALVLNGATIRDAVSGTSASTDGTTVTVPAFGTAGSLRANDLLFISGLLPG